MELQLQFIITHLYSRLGKINFQSHFFAHKYVWITGFAKQRFQQIQLGTSESRSFTPLFPWIAYKQVNKKRS